MSNWSAAEHKEPAPKLTKQEKEFLERFEFEYGKSIMRARGNVYFRMMLSEHEIHGEEINPNMFPFIKPGETWTFEELMKLEEKNE